MIADSIDLRRDVALANRILERTGLSNAFGHASARVAGTETFLLPTRRSPGLAEAATLLVVDFDGNVVAGDGTPNSELWIHARLYAARPDVGGVVHAHPESCVCLTGIGEPHRVVHNQGGPFFGRVAHYDDVGLIRTRALGDRVARTLASGAIATMMRGHGITTACGTCARRPSPRCSSRKARRFSSHARGRRWRRRAHPRVHAGRGAGPRRPARSRDRCARMGIHANRVT